MSREPLRIGSLFTGTGALDLAVMDAFDAVVAWHSQYEPPDKKGREDPHQYAARILARHWPGIPNLGDVTKVDWQAVIEAHGPIDILTGGFPCQDVSSAGKRAGLTADSRSGLWTHFAHAIHELNPRMVIIENVEGLLSANADRGLGLNAEALDKEAKAGRILRALGAVLGDLASLGFHAEWERVAASEVGAPHQRKRVFIYAWPADVDPGCIGRGDGPRIVGGLGTARRDAQAVQDADLEPRDERGLAAPGQAQGRRAWSDAGGRGGAPAADAQGKGRQGRGVRGRPAVHGGSLAPDADGRRREEHQERHRGPEGGQPERERGVDSLGRGVQRTVVLDLRDGEPDLDWGDYEPAIRRWERILGRPAPWPTDALGRLSPVFTEWLMGLPDGWVTDTPGLTRPAMLRALGNGVVWLQASAAIRLLHARAIEDEQEAAA